LDPWPFQGPKTKGFFKYSYGKGIKEALPFFKNILSNQG
jgi:hypothetical protein